MTNHDESAGNGDSAEVHRPVDDFELPWSSFSDFFLSRSGRAEYLVSIPEGTGDFRVSWSVDQWRARVLATAAWLNDRGVREGGVVATSLGNSPDALAVAFAAWVTGACCVRLNPSDDLGRQEYVLRHSGATLLVSSLEAETPSRDVAGRTGIETVLSDRLPTRDEREPSYGSSLSLPALQVYTSGTTGNPKGVVLTASNLLTDCDGMGDRLDWPADTRVLTVLPIHHVNGLIVSSLLPWFAGWTTILAPRFRSDLFWGQVTSEGATVCSMVPSLLEFLLQVDPPVSSTLREVLCGAGPLSVDTVLSFEQRTGVSVRHLYGLSETTAVIAMTPWMPTAERRSWHSSHGFPSIGCSVAHVELAIADDEGNVLESGTRGEIVARGAVVMQEYAGEPDETERAFRHGWFHSGDEGYWVGGPGGRRFFFITGRIKELIIRGGVNISPLEIDPVIRRHPAVDFGLAVPFPNRFYGEEIAAYVVLNAAVTDDELLEYWSEHLDFARQPKVVVRGDEVPFTSTGKAKRLSLARRVAISLEHLHGHQFRRSVDAPSARSLTHGPTQHGQSHQ